MINEGSCAGANPLPFPLNKNVAFSSGLSVPESYGQNSRNSAKTSSSFISIQPPFFCCQQQGAGILYGHLPPLYCFLYYGIAGYFVPVMCGKGKSRCFLGIPLDKCLLPVCWLLKRILLDDTGGLFQCYVSMYMYLAINPAGRGIVLRWP